MYQPQLEAEKSLIGGLLIAPEYIPHVAGEIETDDFYLDESKLAFEAMLALYQDKEQIDYVSVAHRRPQIKEYALYCADLVPNVTLQAIDNYAMLTKEERARRQAYDKAMELIDMLDYREQISSIGATVNDLAKIMDLTKEQDETTIKQGLLTLFRDYKNNREYIKTGYHSLDQKTYIERSDYIVIGGRPSSGKTAFSLNLALHLAKRYHVVYFSLETKNQKIIERLFTTYAGLDFGKLKSRTLNDDEMLKAAQDSIGASKLKLTVVNASGKTVAWIQSKALKLKADIVMIDYIGLIQAKGKSRYEMVSNISVDLHVMAQSLGITVVALSQLNRAGSGAPRMEDLRESGQIEQDADLIMLLHNDKDKGEYTVIVAKNKEGITGAVPMRFDGAKQTFYELETRYDNIHNSGDTAKQ